MPQNHQAMKSGHATKAQAEAGGILNLPAKVPRRNGDTLPTPLKSVTDQLMFRKMKTETDPRRSTRPPWLRRFVLLHRDIFAIESLALNLGHCASQVWSKDLA